MGEKEESTDMQFFKRETDFNLVAWWAGLAGCAKLAKKSVPLRNRTGGRFKSTSHFQSALEGKKGRGGEKK